MPIRKFLLSVNRLLRFVDCYDDRNDSDLMISMGERFYYGSLHPRKYGSNFITGGGGMVFSKMAVRVMINDSVCRDLYCKAFFYQLKTIQTEVNV